MSIHFNGKEFIATTERPKCPACSYKTRKSEHIVWLRVKETRPTDHPQIFIRKYVCVQCGYVLEDEYVLPRSEEDYLTDKDIEIQRIRNKLNGDRIRGARGR